MLWVKVTNPQYDQSGRYDGEVGEVVGRWGPENSADGREGYLVEFADGEIVGVTEEEVEAVREPRRSGREVRGVRRAPGARDGAERSERP